MDIEETRAVGVAPIYNCSKCDNLSALQIVGQKKIGWRTKTLLKRREEIDNIPF